MRWRFASRQVGTAFWSQRVVRADNPVVAREFTAPMYDKKLVFITFFNGGVRTLDIRNPYQPKEVGFFVPAITEQTDKRCLKVDGQERCKVAIQSNNLEVDDRGYIYVVDRANTGMHILELTGDARAIAGMP